MVLEHIAAFRLARIGDKFYRFENQTDLEGKRSSIVTDVTVALVTPGYLTLSDGAQLSRTTGGRVGLTKENKFISYYPATKTTISRVIRQRGYA